MEIKYSTENNGETSIKLVINKLPYTIFGYSRAGLKTSILINEINIVFDMGYSHEKAFSFDNKLISHGHSDHIGALHFDYNARKLYNITKERLIIMPKQCIQPFLMIASAFSEMNCGKCNDIINIFPNLKNTKLIESEFCNDYYKLINSDYWVKSIPMTHKIKSFGYLISKKINKLKSEYFNLKSNELVEIKKTKCITQEIIIPILAYTGDTTIHAIITNEELLNVPLLIMECTGFLEDEIQLCNCGKHIHINDIIKYANLFKNEKIILFHFSQQYKSITELLAIKLPDILQNKIIYFF